MADTHQPAPLTIWYNTLCPVCKTGIDWQTRLLLNAVQRGAIVFADINDQPGALAGFGCDLEDVRKRLHAILPSEQLIVGADVVANVLRITPGLGWLGRLMALPVIRQGSHLLYDGFASLLYTWNRRKGRW